MGRKVLRILFYFLVIAYAIISIGPFIWSIITSLKPTSEVNNFSINFSTLSFRNYIFLWNRFPFARWTLNSIIVALIVTLGNLLFNSMAGYALARINFPGKKALFVSILAFMMIPGQVVMVPTFILLTRLGWINSYKGLTIPFLTSLFGIFLMRQFFLSIPKSLEESAMIDGLGRFGIFFRIILPLAKPALSTQFILMFTGNWNSFLWPSLLATSDKMYTLPVGLNSFYGQYFQFWDQVLAGVMILSIPAIVIFLIFQKNFIKGISTTGMKE
ncbi:carbohydrate ABC transporter membrane protein 2, CUT1 family (TC 3.A.1.1.-) [Alkalithermobacter thermoalcaliphilus JW-YL-7 = DSM 7308]|uniref:ABC-type transporter, integral membrane subunit n=1 Tax=Alkalithermobacter thermoalcaliphilus JW-YL-7 = DSM 7308 TaxID=1121328 RepID=A0A150FQF2_CLOPD|nr:ABC-type transporter, integral membrane subunit [[Clostridium] paradoxum JW-YL-7 = DSM 7308]SHK85710.1 carbohydrate ABC transporter membrane protein 2, CUT1 family (TC 3.A.1.1.-) [[Clostridium] paradoxum JW-YL-7 = DSM 7308]